RVGSAAGTADRVESPRLASGPGGTARWSHGRGLRRAGHSVPRFVGAARVPRDGGRPRRAVGHRPRALPVAEPDRVPARGRHRRAPCSRRGGRRRLARVRSSDSRGSGRGGDARRVASPFAAEHGLRRREARVRARARPRVARLERARARSVLRVPRRRGGRSRPHRPPSPRAKGPPALWSVPRVRDLGRAALGRRHPALVPRLTVATSPGAEPPTDTLSSENGGKLLRYLTAGESHGPALAVVVEGLPAGLPITIDEIAAELARRRLGFGRGPRMRFERDDVEFTGGVRHGRTLGSPVSLVIHNTEWPKWQEEMSPAPGVTEKPLRRPRPGHADLVGMQKYGFDDARNVLERASARETAARVAAGSLAKGLLSHLGAEVVSHVIQLGPVRAAEDRRPV